jgi:hypothetical protein
VALADLGSRAVWRLWTETRLGQIVHDHAERLPPRPTRWIERLNREVRDGQPGVGLGGDTSGPSPPEVEPFEHKRLHDDDCRF